MTSPTNPHDDSVIRYFYDLEFLEDGRTIKPISIGIVCNDGREYYAVNSAMGDHRRGGLGYRVSHHDWLMEHVVPHLPLHKPLEKVADWVGAGWMPPQIDMTSTLVRPLWVIANEVREFLRCDIPAGADIELWADYSAYDHVALCQLWGPMVELPAGIPMFTHDLQQYMRHAEVSTHQLAERLPTPADDAHHALADARYAQAVFEEIRRIERDND